MPIFNRTKPTISVTNGSGAYNFLTGTSGDDYVNADVALHNSDIYSLIFQLSSDLSSGRMIADAQRAQGILNNPTATANPHAFWMSMFAQLLLGGESFAYRWRNTNGQDLRWEYLRPSQVQAYLLADGTGLIYNVSFDEPEIGMIESVPQQDMIHFRLLSKNGGKTAISPLSALSSELQIKDQSNRLTLSALARSIMAPGVLKIQHGGVLDADQKARRSRQFIKQTNESGNGPIVLDDLEDYTPLQVQSNVTQLLSQVNWTSAQIAKVYGVSDSVLNGSGDQQSSLDMIGTDYVKSLSRFSNPIVSELNNKLNANVSLDLRPAVDPLGDSYATSLSNLQKNGTLDSDQIDYLLRAYGYLPEETPVMKGGETVDDESNDQG